MCAMISPADVAAEHDAHGPFADDSRLWKLSADAKVVKRKKSVHFHRLAGLFRTATDELKPLPVVDERSDSHIIKAGHMVNCGCAAVCGNFDSARNRSTMLSTRCLRGETVGGALCYMRRCVMQRRFARRVMLLLLSLPLSELLDSQPLYVCGEVRCHCMPHAVCVCARQASL